MLEDSPQGVYADKVLKVFAKPFYLKFKHVFRLAHGERAGTQLVFLKLEYHGHVAYGEASLPPYLPYTAADVLQAFSDVPWPALSKVDVAQWLSVAFPALEACPPALAAFDIALHSLMAELLDMPLHAMLNIPAPVEVPTTYTIGLSTPAELVDKIEQASQFRLIKLKLGGADDRAAIDAFTAKCALPFCVDVNQGWRNRDEAARLGEYICRKGALFIEQPMPRGCEEHTQWLSERLPRPIIADESVQCLSDLKQYSACFGGVNVKLMKSGGIKAALEWVAECKKLGLMVVLGAMSESSCAVTAAAHLAASAEYVDLDGPLLSANDPFKGLVYDSGYLALPNGNGTGVKTNW